jgi:hypothetical protein
MLGYFGTVPSYVHHHSSEVARWGRDQIYPDIIWLEFVLDPMMLPLFCLWSLNPYWFIPMFLNGHFFRPIPLNPWVSWKHGGFLGDTPKSSRSLDHLSLETYGWLVVSTYLPLRKIFLLKSVGMMTFPIFLWEVIQNSMVPNHQPGITQFFHCIVIYFTILMGITPYFPIVINRYYQTTNQI